METRRATDARGFGLSRTSLYRSAQAGRHERIARGLYRSADAPPADFDLIEAATRRPEAILCLTSALAHHDLIDDIPDAYDLAIPRATRRPATRGAIRWHLFDRDTFGLGREPYPIAGTDLTIGIYTPERCIADAFRLRGSIGYETARDALRTWLGRGGQPAQLAVLARQLPRATGPLMNALDLLT
ncbi:type IV toxin-antitoxin system AbiEi family antitoxin domain-containing protein [Aquipuribacter sp. MA13-6]|uniref:type IV toxin-antitoxin system AbiEi family antitoxin domain-containing protein n=1 Tax=unclassified Aquipuribacter TaxID=2635084 RepID=UPI003EE86D4B